MPANCKRYDAWHNPILPHGAMKTYYQDRQDILAFLGKHMPYQYVVIPDVEIRIKPGDNPVVIVWVTYPGGNTSRDYYPSKRAWDALRKTYQGRKGWTHEITKGGWVVLRHTGTVIKDPSRKYAMPR